MMKNKYINAILLISMLLLLFGCSSKEDKKLSEAEKLGIEVVNDFTNRVTDELIISFVNDCGADIAMLAVIDPVSCKQVNIDALAAGETLSITSNWPGGISDLSWAVYNANGDLVAESTTDISKAKSHATITIIGNGDFESVEEAFE